MLQPSQEPQQPAEVTYEGGAMQITLRNTGCWRIANAVFFLVWIGTWSYGELLSIKVLLATFGYPVTLPFPSPTEHLRPVEIVMAFFAVWLLGWTWMGIIAILQFLRVLFGRDVFELASGEWRVTRHIGPFGRTRAFAPSDGWSPVFRSSAHYLAARRGATYKIVTRLGTIAERKWVRDEILRRFPAPKEGAMPAGYVARAAETGGIIVESDRSCGGTIGCLVVVLLWNVPLVWWLANESKAYIAIWPIVIGIMLALLAFMVLFYRESWLIAPNLVEKRTKIFGITRTTRVTNGTLRIQEKRDNDGDYIHRLYADETLLRSSINDPEPVRAFAEFLARETGWRLEQ
ncbi:MAG TPA: hypothetical protein VN181_00465 [Thermoanaerobaculia bacterium]|nr:hypothetical protein [Thermoanaerobaculia bacterium]